MKMVLCVKCRSNNEIITVKTEDYKTANEAKKSLKDSFIVYTVWTEKTASEDIERLWNDKNVVKLINGEVVKEEEIEEEIKEINNTIVFALTNTNSKKSNFQIVKDAFTLKYTIAWMDNDNLKMLFKKYVNRFNIIPVNEYQVKIKIEL